MPTYGRSDVLETGVWQDDFKAYRRGEHEKQAHFDFIPYKVDGKSLYAVFARGEENDSADLAKFREILSARREFSNRYLSGYEVDVERRLVKQHIEALEKQRRSAESDLAYLDRYLANNHPELREAVKVVSQPELPEGWTQVAHDGLATNADPQKGGIIDKQIVDGKWFFVSHHEDIEPQEGFDTREEAFDAFFEALQDMEGRHGEDQENDFGGPR